MASLMKRGLSFHLNSSCLRIPFNIARTRYALRVLIWLRRHRRRGAIEIDQDKTTTEVAAGRDL
jgi:hypothetical protein